MPMHICIILMDVHTERCLSICWNNLTCVVKDVEDREIRNINKLELTLDNKNNHQGSVLTQLLDSVSAIKRNGGRFDARDLRV